MRVWHRAWLLAGLCSAVAACTLRVVEDPVPADPKTPPRLEGQTAPRLEPTAIAGVQRAAIEVPEVFYHTGKERWFRYAQGRWFVAFLWNGQWFPVDKGELPAEMAALEPTRQEKRERRLTRAEELREIEAELRRLEEEERKARGARPAP